MIALAQHDSLAQLGTPWHSLAHLGTDEGSTFTVFFIVFRTKTNITIFKKLPINVQLRIRN